MPRHEQIRLLLAKATQVEFCYDLLPEEPEDPLDKSEVRGLLRRLRAWVEASVSGGNE